MIPRDGFRFRHNLVEAVRLREGRRGNDVIIHQDVFQSVFVDFGEDPFYLLDDWSLYLRRKLPRFRELSMAYQICLPLRKEWTIHEGVVSLSRVIPEKAVPVFLIPKLLVIVEANCPSDTINGEGGPESISSTGMPDQVQRGLGFLLRAPFDSTRCREPRPLL